MSYSQARSIAGAAQLGLLACLSAGALAADLPAGLAASGLPAPAVWGLWVCAWALAGLPGDWAGGHWLPARHGRASRSLGQWLGGWLRGAAVQAAYFVLGGMLLLVMAQWLGLWGAWGWMLVQMILLLGFQLWMAAGITGGQVRMESDRGRFVFVLDAADRGFTGGITGLPGQESLAVPAYWRAHLPQPVARVLQLRMHGIINTGAHGRGVAAAFLLNALVFLAALMLSGAGEGQLEGLLRLPLLVTLFSSVSRLGLPAWYSRRAVYEADRWAYHKGVDGDHLRAGISAVQRLAEDGGSPLWSGIPPEAERLEALGRQEDLQGGWNTGGQLLYLSWAGINFGARAWPDLLGRPALWVMTPGV
ncbi:MAG: hypothetical protein NW241_00825 [Bacteroidia bacterium]|nr:hypothetical protein [Bacteroidia bacterium]